MLSCLFLISYTGVLLILVALAAQPDPHDPVPGDEEGGEEPDEDPHVVLELAGEPRGRELRRADRARRLLGRGWTEGRALPFRGERGGARLEDEPADSVCDERLVRVAKEAQLVEPLEVEGDVLRRDEEAGEELEREDDGGEEGDRGGRRGDGCLAPCLLSPRTEEKESISLYLAL